MAILRVYCISSFIGIETSDTAIVNHSTNLSRWGENVLAADGQFWDIEAELQDVSFVVVKAEGPFEPPTRESGYIPKSKPIMSSETQSPDSSAPAQPKPTPARTEATAPFRAEQSLTAQAIRDMATTTKAQVTCKFSEVPKLWERPDKRVVFYLMGADPGRIFTVHLKPKIFKKLFNHGFTKWVAAVTGDIGPATETGLELVNASIQVFECKPKDDSTTPAETEVKTAAEPKANAVAQPQKNAEVGKGQAKAEAGAEARPKKGKGLLDGVKQR